jgi:hypothetical protein
VVDGGMSRPAEQFGEGARSAFVETDGNHAGQTVGGLTSHGRRCRGGGQGVPPCRDGAVALKAGIPGMW